MGLGGGELRDWSSAFRARSMSFLRWRKEGSTVAKVSVFVKLRIREGWMPVVSAVEEIGMAAGIRSGRRVVMPGMGVSSEPAAAGTVESSFVSFFDLFCEVSGSDETGAAPSFWCRTRSLCL